MFLPSRFQTGGEECSHVPLRVDDSLEWLTALREVLDSLLVLLLKIQIMTSQMKRHTRPVWDGRDPNAKLLCGTLLVESEYITLQAH